MLRVSSIGYCLVWAENGHVPDTSLSNLTAIKTRVFVLVSYFRVCLSLTTAFTMILEFSTYMFFLLFSLLSILLSLEAKCGGVMLALGWWDIVSGVTWPW